MFTRPLSTGWEDDDEHLAASLAEEIRLSIDFYMAQPEARPAGELILSGPGSANVDLVGELEPLLHLPIRVAEPLGTLDTSAIAGDADPHRYTIAAGLALGAAA
jgi:Tfp pilus assembly PilM family ATPase